MELHSVQQDPRYGIIMILFISLLISNIAYADRRISSRRVGIVENQGPNVCAVEVSDEINYIYYTENKHWNPRNICGKPTFIRYECCAGYYRVPGYPGCIGVKPLTNIIETTRRAGATKFARLIERSSFAEEFRRGSIVTLFAPSDEALDNYVRIKGIRLDSLYESNRLENLIASHITGRRLFSQQWEENIIVQSGLEGHVLRINTFSNGIETVNCHRIIRKDQSAVNGIVHIIDGVLEPALAQNSDIIDLAVRDGRFGIFMKALESSNLANRIRFSEIPYTIFAPTDEAFRSISRAVLTDMLSDPDSLNALIGYHIVNHPVCIPNIISEHHARTMQRQKLTLNCGSYGPTVGHINLGHEMFHGRNGLLYPVDRVLLPDRAKTVLQLVNEEGLQTFLQVIRTAGLDETLTHLKHYTMFAPSETAMYSLSHRQLAELQTNQASARKFVFNHIVTGRYFTDEISSSQIVTTIEERIPLRFQVYRDSFGIENALILKPNREGNNGVLHIISHVLHPAEESLDYILKTDGNFSIWLDAMERIRETQPQIYQEFRRANSSCTYFVPSDTAFHRLGQAKLHSLMTDNNYLAKTLKNHIADDIIISESIKPDLRYSIKTKQDMVNVMKKDNRLLVNDAALVKYDILNKDGVAHEINAVLLPNQCSRGYKKYRDGTVRKVC